MATNEVNVNAKVWRFDTRDEANEYALFLDGHWDNVIVYESRSRTHGLQYNDRADKWEHGPTFLVFAW